MKKLIFLLFIVAIMAGCTPIVAVKESGTPAIPRTSGTIMVELYESTYVTTVTTYCNDAPMGELMAMPGYIGRISLSDVAFGLYNWRGDGDAYDPKSGSGTGVHFRSGVVVSATNPDVIVRWVR